MRKLILIAILTISTLSAFSQKSEAFPNDSITKVLVGIWEIDKIVDKDDKVVETITKEIKGSPLGDEIKIKATGPKMTLNVDGTYELEFTPQNIYRGKWYIGSPDTLIFQLITKKGTNSYNMLKTAAEMFGKTVNYDSDGNIVENNPIEIVKLDKGEMMVRYETDYFQVYKKKK